MEHVDSDGNLIAGISGTLVTMTAVEGAYVSNTMPVVTIVGNQEMKVTASVSEALVPKLSAGGTADVYVSSLDQTFSATIRSVDRSASMQTQPRIVFVPLPGFSVTIITPAIDTQMHSHCFLFGRSRR